MSCCFLLYHYRDEYNDPLQTLQFYAQQRTSNEKGVTIPSQRRYVEYFGHLLNSQVLYSPKQIVFTGLLITYKQNQVRNSSLLIWFFEKKNKTISFVDFSQVCIIQLVHLIIVYSINHLKFHLNTIQQ